MRMKGASASLRRRLERCEAHELARVLLACPPLAHTTWLHRRRQAARGARTNPSAHQARQRRRTQVSLALEL